MSLSSATISQFLLADGAKPVVRLDGRSSRIAAARRTALDSNPTVVKLQESSDDAAVRLAVSMLSGYLPRPRSGGCISLLHYKSTRSSPGRLKPSVAACDTDGTISASPTNDVSRGTKRATSLLARVREHAAATDAGVDETVWCRSSGAWRVPSSSHRSHSLHDKGDHAQSSWHDRGLAPWSTELGQGPQAAGWGWKELVT